MLCCVKSKMSNLVVCNRSYYMASSMSKSCSAIGYPGGYAGAVLPTRDYPPCPIRINFPESYLVINPLLTKLFRLRLLDIARLFCEVIDLDSVSVHKHAK